VNPTRRHFKQLKRFGLAMSLGVAAVANNASLALAQETWVL
jgi:hypothetical protein